MKNNKRKINKLTQQKIIIKLAKAKHTKTKISSSSKSLKKQRHFGYRYISHLYLFTRLYKKKYKSNTFLSCNFIAVWLEQLTL